MTNHLYDIFSKWSCTDGEHRNSIWIYGDPHFDDEESKSFRGNEYPGDEEQVRRINSKVGRKDTIIFLGDIGDVEFIKKIRGYKILLLGNHDKGASNYKRTKDENLFDEVYEGPLTINDRLILSHEPIQSLPDYLFNIHGHAHDKKDCGERHLNVCAEHIDYTPICLSSLLQEGLLKEVHSIHRTTIDSAIVRKAKKTRKKKSKEDALNNG